MNKVILASASEGRKRLFETHIKHFAVAVSKVDEEAVAIDDPRKLVCTLALMKAVEVSKKFPDDITIGFDTVVVCDGKVIGKPADKDEAIGILKQIRGKRQLVLTGYAIVNLRLGLEINDYVETVLNLKNMSDEFIAKYVQSHPVTRFAGGYGVQDNDQLIEILSGDFDNVVGAPMRAIINHLKDLGYIE
ncbi:MAG: septum formation protein Maf [Brevinematales bacterium]|nr:septum formation protein Maf [Brevinematales bacterium]